MRYLNPESIDRDRYMGTEGPWEYVRSPSDEHEAEINGDGWWSLGRVVVRMADDDFDNPEGLANLRRITRVPELETAFLLAVKIVKTVGDLSMEEAEDATNGEVRVVVSKTQMRLLQELVRNWQRVAVEDE